MSNYIYKNKIFEIGELKKIITEYRCQNQKIVFTNGCFDILHVGHIRYLQQSKQLGDILIIGLNSDKSVKRLKGPSRPINNENDRASMLEALGFVDYVVIFDEDTPLRLIQELEPDIYTKSGDYTRENIIGKGLGADLVESYGGKVVIQQFVDGYSTTSIINKSKR